MQRDRAASGFRAPDASRAQPRHADGAGLAFAASMLRDIERGGRTEGDHILGDFIRRGERGLPEHSLLRLADTHLKAYEAREERSRTGH